MWSPAEVGREFDLTPSSLSPLEPFRDYLTIVSNTDVRNAEAFLPRNRRRSLPLERGVPDAGAPEADRRLRRPRRDVARSALRAEVRPGHADSVDAAVHRERRSGRRLRLRLCLRLHRHDQLGVADEAAADDARPARRVRSVVRRRRHAGGARRPPRRPTAASSTGSTTEVSRLRNDSGPDRPRAADRLSRGHPRDRAPHSEGRSAQQQRRAARAARRADRRARLVRAST